MRPNPPPNYLAGYPVALTEQVQRLIEQGLLADMLLQKYPLAHAVRTDKALYDTMTTCWNPKTSICATPGLLSYQLCRHMEPDYHQLEFDLRACLTYLDAAGLPLWAGASVDAGMPLGRADSVR